MVVSNAAVVHQIPLRRLVPAESIRLMSFLPFIAVSCCITILRTFYVVEMCTLARPLALEFEISRGGRAWEAVVTKV